MFCCQPAFSGDYANTLEQKTFTDARKTNYLEAVKYVANLVWNGEIILSSLNFKLEIFVPNNIIIPQSTVAPREATGGTSPTWATPRRSLRSRLGRKTTTTRRRSRDGMKFNLSLCPIN